MIKYFDNIYSDITNLKLDALIYYLINKNIRKLKLIAYVGNDIFIEDDHGIHTDEDNVIKINNVEYKDGEFTIIITEDELKEIGGINQFSIILRSDLGDFAPIITKDIPNQEYAEDGKSIEIKYNIDFGFEEPCRQTIIRHG